MANVEDSNKYILKMSESAGISDTNLCLTGTMITKDTQLRKLRRR